MDAKRGDRAVPSSVRDGRRRVVPSVVPSAVPSVIIPSAVPSIVLVLVARVAEMLGTALAVFVDTPVAAPAPGKTLGTTLNTSGAARRSSSPGAGSASSLALVIQSRTAMCPSTPLMNTGRGRSSAASKRWISSPM